MYENLEIAEQQERAQKDMNDLLETLEAVNATPGYQDLNLTQIAWVRDHKNASPAEIAAYLQQCDPYEAASEY